MTSEKTFLLAVVTYRSNEHYGHIRSALASYLAKREKDIAIIVENSGDCSAEEIGRGLPGVHMLFPSRNIGFSPAVNLAYQTALERTGSIDAVILINPDLLVDGDRILRLVEYASRNASIGVCSALLRDSDGAIDQGSARRRWNRRRLFAEWAGSQAYCSPLMTKSRNLSAQEVTRYCPDIVSGAFMYIRAEVLQGGLDTRLPMYLEDQEICHRALSLGYSVSLAPGLEVVHIGGDSRRAAGSGNRALRIMELVVAPILSFQDWHGGSLLGHRIALIAAAACRLLATPPILAYKLCLRSEKHAFYWAFQQCQLSYWFISWALFGQLEIDRSLTERLANSRPRKGARAS